MINTGVSQKYLVQYSCKPMKIRIGETKNHPIDAGMMVSMHVKKPQLDRLPLDHCVNAQNLVQFSHSV